uniref:Uncharacterized protein n=1 Tax=Chromera velia CCMP2878 TaxID=1169474 RepID=A0A0G4HWR1_9ALVE|eukprot:Cvel_9093.t1-p1 / transcript=Cvel_9093.t1 / gene=Cvel_9093 / organism=Chromera_velia_CCMP2878 / gene_product=hypothetical protein / transcript_product=hypothetical protein / location=Cvel_scaffold516:28475-33451(+) / protein_length=562 / sequence_SO=supercontig / SO=protein_coding / is_pseudo=false
MTAVAPATGVGPATEVPVVPRCVRQEFLKPHIQNGLPLSFQVLEEQVELQQVAVPDLDWRQDVPRFKYVFNFTHVPHQRNRLIMTVEPAKATKTAVIKASTTSVLQRRGFTDIETPLFPAQVFLEALKIGASYRLNNATVYWSDAVLASSDALVSAYREVQPYVSKILSGMVGDSPTGGTPFQLVRAFTEAWFDFEQKWVIEREHHAVGALVPLADAILSLEPLVVSELREKETPWPQKQHQMLLSLKCLDGFLQSIASLSAIVLSSLKREPCHEPRLLVMTEEIVAEAERLQKEAKADPLGLNPPPGSVLAWETKAASPAWKETLELEKHASPPTAMDRSDDFLREGLGRIPSPGASGGTGTLYSSGGSGGGLSPGGFSSFGGSVGSALAAAAAGGAGTWSPQRRTYRNKDRWGDSPGCVTLTGALADELEPPAPEWIQRRLENWRTGTKEQMVAYKDLDKLEAWERRGFGSASSCTYGQLLRIEKMKVEDLAGNPNALKVAQQLSRAYRNLREYISSSRERLDLMDPDLAKDEGLVKALGTFERSYRCCKRLFLEPDNLV